MQEADLQLLMIGSLGLNEVNSTDLTAMRFQYFRMCFYSCHTFQLEFSSAAPLPPEKTPTLLIAYNV